MRMFFALGYNLKDGNARGAGFTPKALMTSTIGLGLHRTSKRSNRADVPKEYKSHKSRRFDRVDVIIVIDLNTSRCYNNTETHFPRHALHTS